jgi:branched-chain amino acid transport system ATP-binding protein
MSYFSVENVSVQFGGLKAVDGVSFDVEKGEIFTIIGPNGAGKTTLFNLISRLYNVTTGRIVFKGEDITQLSAQQIAGRGIARTFQNIELFENASTLQNLLVGRHRHSKTRFLEDLLFMPRVRREEVVHRRAVEEVMDFLQLQRYRDALIGGLPYGVRKVIEVGRALCVGPEILLLDEPSSGLNVEETDRMADWILEINTRLGITILMVEHDMSLVSRVSDRVLALNYGRIMAMGTSQEVQSHPDVVAAYLGA